MTSAEEFIVAFYKMKPGTRYVYHTGDLAVDRSMSRALDKLADTVLMLSQQKAATLYQKRLGRSNYEYSLVKTDAGELVARRLRRQALPAGGGAVRENTGSSGRVYLKSLAR